MQPNFNREGGRRTFCKKCNSWHGEKERCRTSTPTTNNTSRNDTRRPEVRPFDPRNKINTRVSEAELEFDEVEDTMVEENDQQSVTSEESTHF